MPAYHVLDLSSAAMLLLNIALLSAIGWGLLHGERRLADGRELALLGLLAGFFRLLLFGLADGAKVVVLPDV